MDTLLIKSINGENLERPPVWCMRQAGRYLPEYQELRKKNSFNQISENPELTTEVTLQPIKRFPELDAAIIFADILTPSKAMGFEFEFKPGPVLSNPIKTPDDIKNLKIDPVKTTVSFVFEALNKIRHSLEQDKTTERKSLLGFAASPWTLACYLIDQGIYKQHIGTSVFARKYPESFELLCEKITEVTIEYLKEKIKNGADAVQIFDTWGTLLSPSEYFEYSGKWISRIIKALQKENHKVLLYIPGGMQHIHNAINLHPDVISVDWRSDLAEIDKIVPPQIAIQGNLNPAILFTDTDTIYSETLKMCNSLKRRTGFIANLGHGILPETPISGMKAFLNGVHDSWKK